MALVRTPGNDSVPDRHVLLGNLIEQLKGMGKRGQFGAGGEQRSPRIHIRATDFGERAFDGGEVVGLGVEREEGVGDMGVGPEPGSDGVGVELGAEGDVARIGGGGEGGGEGVVVGREGGVGEDEEAEGLGMVVGASEFCQHLVQLQETFHLSFV